MTRLCFVFLGIIAVFHAKTSDAAILASDNFSYADGNLATNNGGTGWSTAWGNANGNTAGSPAVQVVSGQVSSSSSFIYRGLTTTFGSSGDIWISFDYRRDAGIVDGIAFHAGTSERALVGTLLNSFWTLGKDGLSTAGNVANTDDVASPIKTGVVHFTLGTGATGSADLWVGSGVGPVDITVAPDATLTGMSLSGINTFRIGSTGAQVIDNFVMGTSSADVAAIPEPSLIALTMVSFLGLGMGYRNRRRLFVKY